MTLHRTRVTDNALVLLLSISLVTLSFLLQANIGIDLADEGYLWHGVLRTAAGDIPTLDFRSYDPGRYYWILIGSKLFSLNILGIRASVACFQALGLYAGLLTIKKITNKWQILAAAGLLFVVWMYPRHKWFEHSITLLAVYLTYALLDKPSNGNHFISGLFIGLAGFFGRNHGLYTLTITLLSLLFIYRVTSWERQRFKSIGYLILGVVIGYSPMLFIWGMIPNSFQTYLNDKVLVYFHRGYLNLPKPIPWPWTLDLSGNSFSKVAPDFFTGLALLLLPFSYILAIISINKKWPETRQTKLLLATSLVGIIYMHHAYSRADISHLAQSLLPFLIGAISLPFVFKSKSTKLISHLVIVFTIIVTLILLPTISPLADRLFHSAQYQLYDLNGNFLWLPERDAEYIRSIESIFTEMIPENEMAFIAPNKAGLYPLLGRDSPTYSSYLVFEQEEATQLKLIADLEDHDVQWIYLVDVKYDGREDLRFINTHPFVWDYILNNFEIQDTPQLPSNHRLFKRTTTKIQD